MTAGVVETVKTRPEKARTLYHELSGMGIGVSKVLTANQMPSSWGSAPAQPGQLDWLAQTHYQDVSKSVAVAEGSNRLS